MNKAFMGPGIAIHAIGTNYGTAAGIRVTSHP